MSQIFYLFLATHQAFSKYSDIWSSVFAQKSKLLMLFTCDAEKEYLKKQWSVQRESSQHWYIAHPEGNNVKMYLLLLYVWYACSTRFTHSYEASVIQFKSSSWKKMSRGSLFSSCICAIEVNWSKWAKTRNKASYIYLFHYILTFAIMNFHFISVYTTRWYHDT